MKLFPLILGFILGSITTALAMLVKELVKGYDSISNNDPWQEYQTEEDEVRASSCDCHPADIDHTIWMNQVRRESHEDGADLGFVDPLEDDEL
jgi:hypothetical protein